MKLKSSQAKETNGETDTSDKQRGPWEGLTPPRGAGAQEPGLKQEWESDSWGGGGPSSVSSMNLMTEEGAGRTPHVHGGGSGDTEETRSDVTRDSQLKSQGWGLTNNLELSPST